LGSGRHNAPADQTDIFAWTDEHFGEQARLRYEALVVTALRDIVGAPERVGSIGRVLYDGMELSRHLNPDTPWV